MRFHRSKSRHVASAAVALAVLVSGFFVAMNIPGKKINVLAPEIGAGALKRVTSRGWPVPAGHYRLLDEQLVAAYYEATECEGHGETTYHIRDLDRGFYIDVAILLALSMCVFVVLDLALVKKDRA